MSPRSLAVAVLPLLWPLSPLQSAALVPPAAQAFVSRRALLERGSAVVLSGGYTSDVSMSQNFYNRERSQKGDYSGKIVKRARIVALADPGDANNSPLYDGPLPGGAELLAVGTSMKDFDLDDLKQRQPTVVFVSHSKAREPLNQLLNQLPSIEWVQTRSAGVEYLLSDELAGSRAILTNAKGMYSSTLAEYTIMACSYFAKDLPRLLRQKDDKKWEKYSVLELRGATMGIIGYGDIGRACAILAKAYGMKVVALRRNPKLSMYDPYCDQVYGNDDIHTLMSQSDYVVVAAPLTESTRGLVSRDVLSQAKKDAVLVNIGRGPVVDEDALIDALRDGTLKGAGLDVTTVEPLPADSPLWTLDNVLLSPHCMDKTATFERETTEFFVNENLPRYVRGLELFNPVDKVAGY